MSLRKAALHPCSAALSLQPIPGGPMNRFNLLVAVGAAALLSVCVSTATAGRLSTSSPTFRSTFRELRLRLPFGTTNCPVTLEGTLHSSTLAKVAGSLIGYITRASVANVCTSGPPRS